MTRISLSVMILTLTACARPDVCDRVEGRLSAAKEFCQSLSMTLAREQCGGSSAPDSREFAQCLDLMLIKGMESCVPMTGAERLVWVMSEFCSE